VLIGGNNDKAYRRAARFDGWTAGGGGIDAFAAARAKVAAAWKDAGRDGAPRTAKLAYFALGDDPEGAARRRSALTTPSSATTPRTSWRAR
jgi:alkanesulfonate monooxygenase SsuD/methylene tetrahydromethanopterin reductase-like flavin-dependent oxidoreductase (luciferase family)